jgi:hypothetical protein
MENKERQNIDHRYDLNAAVSAMVDTMMAGLQQGNCVMAGPLW